MAEPSMRNSNLLPVKAKGEVRFRSVVSMARSGSTCTPVSSFSAARPHRGVVLNGLQNGGELIPQEHGNDGGRGLVGAQPVVVAGRGHRDAQQVLIFVHALDNGRQEQQELGVFGGFLAGVQQVLAGVCGDGPVVVLAAAVDPIEGLSWSRQTKPCLAATFFMVSMVSWLWSVAMLVVVKMGASSCWAGATSLCLVLARMPSFHSSSSRSFIKAATRA